jgi:glycosyltransferase involved in cell wall biosynthesis
VVAGRSIGLCMIVRDEEAVIGRCLTSALPLIDTWTICDTGSTDATADLVAEVLAGVPGELHRRPWVDFGHNRSEAIALARGRADPPAGPRRPPMAVRRIDP